MDHLTNLYKHKCEQLQEQLYNLTRMLNEAVPPGVIRRIPDIDGPGGNGPGGPGRFIPNGPDGNPRGYGRNNPTIDPAEIARREAEAAAAAALATRERIAEMFRRLPPTADEWMQAYNYLSEAEKAIFNTMYGAIGNGIDGVMRVGVAGGNVFVRIIREPNGVSGIYYWNATTMNWIRFENGYYVRGVGANMGSGIKYSKQWISSIDPSSGDVFSPAPGRPHNFNKTPNITPGSGDVQGGGAGGGGLGNQTGNPG